MNCYYFTPPEYFFYGAEAPLLLYYSHYPAIALSILFGLFVLFNNPKSLTNRLFAIISFLFAAWALINIHLWTSVNADAMTFTWSMLGITQGVIAVLAVWMVHSFFFDKDLGLKSKIGLLVLLLPVLLLGHTDANISGFNISDCDAFGFENMLFNTYYHLLGAFAFVWIAYFTYKKFKLEKGSERIKDVLFGSGVLAFILLFYGIVYISAYFTEIGVTDDSVIEMYGMYGMTAFQAVITFLMVRFKAFNVSLSAASALVLALLAITASQATFAESTSALVFTAVNVLLTVVVGYILIRSVRREIKQRKELEKLTKDLEKANKRLKELDKLKSEFVSIASHQLRSPLTSIRGYASMLAEGSFGKLPAKGVEPVERIAESARLMAVAVEDYLNVSRIESGNMKYNMADFNLKEEAEKITDDIRPNAVKKGLMLMFKNQLNSSGIVNADIGKSVQIIHNLINNSLKYTPKGSITVIMRDDLKKKKVFVDVTDTGIGMSQETIDKVFEKFERADNANSVNVAGTGLGLFVALKMAHAMKGDITATSEGDGKGSTFTFELPLVQ